MNEQLNIEPKSFQNTLFFEYIESSVQQPIPSGSHMEHLNNHYAVYLKYDQQNPGKSFQQANQFIEMLSQLIGRKPELITQTPSPYHVKKETSKASLEKIGKSENGLTDVEFITTYVSSEKTPTRIFITLNEADYFTMRTHDIEIQRKNEVKLT
jgi:hypothetical protein